MLTTLIASGSGIILIFGALFLAIRYAKNSASNAILVEKASLDKRTFDKIQEAETNAVTSNDDLVDRLRSGGF